jgi:hypothetical protein
MRFSNDSQRKAMFANMTGRNSFASSSFLNLGIDKIKFKNPNEQVIPERVSSSFGVILPRKGTIITKEIELDTDGRVIWTKEIEEPLEETYVDLGVDNRKETIFVPRKEMGPIKSTVIDILK